MTIAPYAPLMNSNRVFNPNKEYRSVNWRDFCQAVDQFCDRVYLWYIRPARILVSHENHIGFPVVSICCQLIDGMSQYRYGRNESDKGLFIDFVRAHIRQGKERLPAPIKHIREKASPTSLQDYAQVLYFGYRCGILHEFHAKLYCMILAQGDLFVCYPHGYTLYDDGSDCPSVIVDPFQLLDEVELYFWDYIGDLLNPSPGFAWLRENFRKKFLWAHGIQVGPLQ